MGVILDSSVVIEAEHLNVAQFLKQIVQRIGEMEAALCAITVAESAHGIYRADTSERRKRRRIFLDELKAAVPVYPITDGTAELVGKIGAESSAAGITIPFDDLLIAASALERGYAVATRNLRHFRRIPGLNLISLLGPATALHRVHAANSIHTVPPFLRNLRLLAEKERAGRYPGGPARRYDRRAYLGGPFFF